MKKIIGSICLVLLLSGCYENSVSVCPIYPKPSQEVLTRIKSLNSRTVDLWMIKQYKLNKKLDVCNVVK